MRYWGAIVVVFAGLGLDAIARAEPPRRAAVLIAGVRTGREADELASKVRAALAERPDLELLAEKDEAFIFRSPKPKTGRSKSALAAAKKHLEAAEKALGEFDLASAVKAVTKAKTTLQPWIGLRGGIELDRSRLQLAVQIAHAQRDEQRLTQALREYAVRFPGEPPPQGLWPPDVLNRLKNASDDRPTVLNVRSEPRGTVFIDGREVGPTPVRLGALPAGEHRVEIVAPNHYSNDAWVETSGAKESVVDVTLIPNFGKRLEKVKLDKPFDPALVTAIREVAPVDFVIVAHVAAGSKLVLRRVDVGPRGSGATEGVEVANGDASPSGIRLALAALFEARDRATVVAGGGRGREGRSIPTWAWIGGGAGAIAVGAGVMMRMMSVSTYQEFGERQGALTQTEAYELRDRSDSQAMGGTVLLGIGVAAIAGVAGWLAYEMTEDSP